MPREDLDHPGKRRHAVESPLWALHDLDPVDVLDGDLGERRVEGAAHGNTVHRHEEGVELLQTPPPDVREPAAVVGPAAGVEAYDVLERLGHGLDRKSTRLNSSH